ncbi:MAG: hypothetical protein HQM02_12020 [Magnetococcales bacterium]|nr:hypothetical protein [Magnetococcales bacterium]
MWQGEDLTGRSLLILPEQGFGDQLHFCRAVPRLKAMGVTTLTLACDAPLLPLLRSLPEVDQVVVANREQTYPRHDYWIFLLSLPLRLERLPADLPYLRPPEARSSHWETLLANQPGFRVGLVWKGDCRHPNDFHRSLPGLATLAPLWGVDGVVFVNLQQGPGGEEGRNPPVGQPLLQPGESFQDFGDTAALVSRLDLVITIDSAVAHLAGALGKPCWVMLSAFGCDWRWMREGEETPWYPGVMRLFRQTVPDDWSTVVASMTDTLARLSVGTR